MAIPVVGLVTCNLLVWGQALSAEGEKEEILYYFQPTPISVSVPMALLFVVLNC